MEEKLHARKRLRIKGYDYSQENSYFVTICTKDKIKILGNIKENIDYMELTDKGIIVQKNIDNIEKIYNNVTIDEYIVMPNHVHMIIMINDKGKNNLSEIIRQYKSSVSKELKNSIWQKSFYEHIIRNEKEYIEIKKYIQNNIINWKYDKYF